MAFNLFGKRDKTPEPESEPFGSSSPLGLNLTTPLPAAQEEEVEPQQRRGFFDRMRAAVTRTRTTLQDRMGSLVALTREVDLASLDDLEAVLLATDIGTTTTALILESLRERAMRQGIKSGAELKRLLRAELLAVLHRVAKPITHPSTPPDVIMMVGVNGTGKTTTTGKLAALYRAQNKSVLLCAADTFRAAAIEQLEVWAQRSDVPLIKTKQGGDPSAALYDACAAAKARSSQVLIVDTAGRLHTKSDLMKELDKMRRTAEKLISGAPHQVLLVLDATTGQNGLTQARLFTESAHVTGIVLTKLDGTAKGGIVLAIATDLGLPVLYAGTGEKLEDLIPFNPESFVDSLLD